MRLLLTGGGTGGHVYPLVAVLQHLAAAQKLNLTSEVLYVGRRGGVEERIAAGLKLPFRGLAVSGIRSLGPLTQVRNAGQMLQAAGDAGQVLAEFRPDAVLATGGYVSAPVLWAASRKKIPIVIELPDLEPGWAIQATWRLSKQVAVSFNEVLHFFPKGRATVTGFPVRQEFFQATRAAGRAHFQLDSSRPVVTVFGGSQGAHVLNQAVQANLAELLETTQVVHICGTKDEPELQAARAALAPERAAQYQVYAYLDEDMPLALAAADVIVARAGAATLGEFPAVGVPSILVPGLFAAGHQAKNAEFLAGRGAAIHLPEQELANGFFKTITGLLGEPKRLEQMRDAARGLAQPDAARRIGEIVMSV